MTRHRRDDLRRQIYEDRTADQSPWVGAVWGLVMYGHWDGPDRSEEDETTEFPRTSFWECLGIGQLLGQEPSWRKDR